MIEKVLACLILLLPAVTLSAGERVNTCATEISLEEKSNKTFNVNITGIGIVIYNPR